MRRSSYIWFAWTMVLLGCLAAHSHVAFARPLPAMGDSVAFVCRELLGRPTDHSIALNMCADTTTEWYVEYGTAPASYAFQTPVQTLQPRIAATITIAPLNPDTRYFYRVRYRAVGATAFAARDEHTFQTARPAGRPFVFAVEADPHLDTASSPAMFRRTLTNIQSAAPDFLLDLGDTFMSEKLPGKTFQQITARHLLLRSFFDTLCHSVPLMLVIGNHEGECGWELNGTPDNLAVWASTVRMSYYPNPVPDGFYSGDTTAENFVGLRQNYYAWEWGNALFVVLDPYWYTNPKPGSSKDIWDWTLGRTQYDWFERTLTASNRPFKFVFAHQIIGGNNTDGRGGIEAVPFYEMGGLNADSTWGFTANRPGWPKPIHQLMVEHHVTAFFHGHDHVYVQQDLDGIVYQEVPQPGYFNYTNTEKSYSNTGLAAQHGYTHGVIRPSSGFLRVTVADTTATVDYVRSVLPEHENVSRHNGEVFWSYSVQGWNGTTSVDRSGATPEAFALSQNYPNPFNPETRIRFQVPGSSKVDLRVYDILGREVAVLVDEVKPPGTHEVRWNASAFSSGVYFARLKAGNDVMTKAMCLLK